jgi:hypothetical protein
MTTDAELGLSLVRGAGWFFGRRVAVDSYLEAMAKGGYERSDLVEEFLAEYGGLSVGAPAGGFAEVLAVDPVMAIESTSRNTVQMYEEAVGGPLTPVGGAYSGHLLVMMSGAGRFYGGYDMFFAFAGDTPTEMFGRISSERLEQILIDDE